ncbi:MAG: ABC transporter ATP-binding protein [Pseudomonadota bacterium]
MLRWLEGQVNPFPAAEPEKPPTTFWAFMLHFARPFQTWILLAMALTITVAILEVLLFWGIGQIIDWIGTSDRATFFETHGTWLLLLGLLALVILPVLNFLNDAIYHSAIFGNFPMRNRWEGHRYLLRQSVQFFQDDFAGRVSTKVMQSALAIREIVIKIAEIGCYVGTYFLTAVIMFAIADWRLALPMLVWLGCYAATLWFFLPKMAKVAEEQAELRSVVTGRIVDSYTNITTVKMFAHGQREDAYAREGMEPFLTNTHLQMRLATLLQTALVILNAGLITSVAGLGVWLWSGNLVTAGAIAFAVGLVLRLQGMAHWIMWETANLFENIGTVRDGIDTIARERAVVDVPDAKPLQVTDAAISYDRIVFDYGKMRSPETNADATVPPRRAAPRVIDQLSLDIRAGEKVGLVGRSGAGKSTLVNLLLRFYDLEAGAIRIDGQDISQVTQESLRANIAMVTQDTSLLHRSVLDNILYGRPDASPEAAIAAAKRAEAHDFILDLADGKGRTGYDAHVGERGVKLSGGQRQRIAIARVLVKDAPILILDEATSALDSEVEAAIQEQLYNLMEGKTVIAIAHRLSTIAQMDRLVVMDQGAIIEDGTHDALIEKGGLYADLWTRQSGGFLSSTETSEAAE